MMQPEQRGTIYIASPYAQWIIIIILGMMYVGPVFQKLKAQESTLVSQSLTQRGTYTHTLKSRPKSVINKILEHEWEE